MHGLHSYERALFIVQALALFGLIVSLLWSGLSRIYPFFFWYLVVQLAQFPIPFLTRRGVDLYAYAFFATEGLIVCFYALIVLELYSLVFRDLRGIASIARRYIKFALALAVGISLLILELERIPSGFLGKFFTVERTIVSSLVIFVFLITAFLVYYPIPLNRNVIGYSLGYAVYFTGKATALFLKNTGHDWVYGLDTAVLGISTACLIFWLAVLTPERERKAVVWGHQWNPGDDQKLLSQLEAINASLLRVRK